MYIYSAGFLQESTLLSRLQIVVKMLLEPPHNTLAGSLFSPSDNNLLTSDNARHLIAFVVVENEESRGFFTSKKSPQPKISQGMSVSCLPSLLVSGWTVPHIRGHRGPPQAQKLGSKTPKATRFVFVHTQIA